MNRQTRRNEQRLTEKIENKFYTATECKAMLKRALEDHEKFIQSKYDKVYTLCMASTLSALPLNFGRKRACAFMNLFFDQIECIASEVITYEQIEIEAKKLGVTISTEDGKFVVHLNPSKKGIKKEKKI